MCAVTSSGRHRRAFTLIEMLVVMGIILLLATLGVAYLPKMSDNQKRTRAVDLVSQWLLTAKERAKRDRLPTGVRLLPDPNNPTFDPTKPILVSQLQYVQQPDPITGGQLVYYASAPAPAGYFGPIANNIYVIGGICLGGTGGLITFAYVDFVGGAITADQYLVQANDYLELGGNVHQITNNPTVTSSGTQVPLASPLSFGPGTPGWFTTNYRIFRQPRPLVGEDVLQLPPDMVIDLGYDTNGNPPGIPGNPRSHVPQRQTVTGVPAFEILFSPTGEVIGTGSGGKVLLLVRDSTVLDNPYDPAATSVVSINPRTGLIAAQPVAPYNPAIPLVTGNDPYANTEDARSSGM